MTQMSIGLDPLPKKTRKEIFLEEMNVVVPWSELVALIQPHARGAHQALGGRPPFALETMLRIHCLQLWWSLSDPAMEEELHERPLYRRVAGLDGSPRVPDETTILRFRHLLEKQELAPKIMAVINAGLAREGLMLKRARPARWWTRPSSWHPVRPRRATSGTSAGRCTSVWTPSRAWCTPSSARRPTSAM